MDKPDRIQVWHDGEGNVRAWGYVPASADGKLSVVPEASEGLQTLDVAAPEEHFEDLHEHYRVDPAAECLVPHARGGREPGGPKAD